MLCSLSNKRKELRIEQSKVDNQFIRYMNDLQHSLQSDEDLTVILADTFSPLPDIPEFAIVAKDGMKDCRENDEEWSEHSFVLKPAPPERSGTPPLDSSRVSRFACFSGGVFEHCDSGISDPNSYTTRIRDQEAGLGLFPDVSNPSPSAMRAGAQAWREQQGRLPTTENIDFRTGMSGHMALLSSHAHSHKYLEQNRLNNPGRMSSHTGLGNMLPSLNGILNSLTLPAIGSTPPRRSEREGILHNGSM
jgi:hypothetical protein